MVPPVLFLVFNRPDTTAKALGAIRAARPPRLYVAADGPRPGRPEDLQRCEAVRRIATNVDWPCEVFTLFREKNLGCRIGLSGAISWFFDLEEEGIILEDDCIASPSFFTFCADLLVRYRHDNRIMHITGDNFQTDMGDYPYSYYFSKYTHCWGWASWRRAWALYDKDMTRYDDFMRTEALATMSRSAGFEAYWRNIFQTVKDDKIDAWDYVWVFSCWAQNGLTCTPRENLVSNIGFGYDATHTIVSDAKCANLPTGELGSPLRHPSTVAPDQVFDAFVDRNHFGINVSPPRSRICSLAKALRRRF